jgi:allantoicase
MSCAPVEKCKNVATPSPFQALSLLNLCSASNGSKILFSTDDWFAVADNLLKDEDPVFIDDLFCEQGKVMDGWESRRRREPGHDWCLIQLAPNRAQIVGVELDTAHFTGNHVPKVSLEIADTSCAELSGLVSNLPYALDRMLHGGVRGTGASPEEVSQAKQALKLVEWKELLPETPLRPGFEPTRMHYFTLNEPLVGNLVRVNYYPDGGVARLRLWGHSFNPTTPVTLPLLLPMKTGEMCTVVPHSSTETPPCRLPYEYPELSSQANGGIGVACSNKHFGEPWRLTQTTLGENMGDGWETARHPSRPSILVKDPKTNLIDSPLMDWAILKLGEAAINGVARAILDTRFFCGNPPESVMVEGCFSSSNDETEKEEMVWFPLISRVRMSPDSEHVFERSQDQIQNATKPVSHVRLSIYPDGGLSRVRIYG